MEFSLVFVMFFLLLGIVSPIIYLIFRGLLSRLNIKNQHLSPRRLKIYTFLFVLFSAGYLAYDAVYPSDSFYVAEYERLTEREIPKSAKIKYKESAYPDHFGKYHSVSHIEVSEEDFHQLLKIIENDKDFSLIEIHANELKSFKKRIKNSSRGEGYLTFLKDKKTIICYLDFY